MPASLPCLPDLCHHYEQCGLARLSQKAWHKASHRDCLPHPPDVGSSFPSPSALTAATPQHKCADIVTPVACNFFYIPEHAVPYVHHASAMPAGLEELGAKAFLP